MSESAMSWYYSVTLVNVKAILHSAADHIPSSHDTLNISCKLQDVTVTLDNM